VFGQIMLVTTRFAREKFKQLRFAPKLTVYVMPLNLDFFSFQLFPVTYNIPNKYKSMEIHQNIFEHLIKS